MNIQNLVLDINKKCNQIVTANVGEVDSRLLKISVIDNGVPMDLTGITVYLYAKKTDGTKVFNTVKVEDAKQGVVLVEITSQVLALEGFVKLTLLLTKDKARLASKIFTLKVDETIVDDEALESTNEFTALTDALGRVNNIDNRFENVNLQLTHKANLNSVFNMANMGQDVKEAMTGGSVAVVGRNTVLSENIVDNQVTPSKVSFVNSVSGNIIQLNDAIYSGAGITVTVKDNIITINGKSTSQCFLKLTNEQEFTTSPSVNQSWVSDTITNIITTGETYTMKLYEISGSSTNAKGVILSVRDASRNSMLNSTSNTTNVIPNDASFIQFFIEPGVTFDNYQVCCGLVSGDTIPTEYIDILQYRLTNNISISEKDDNRLLKNINIIYNMLNNKINHDTNLSNDIRNNILNKLKDNGIDIDYSFVENKVYSDEIVNFNMEGLDITINNGLITLNGTIKNYAYIKLTNGYDIAFGANGGDKKSEWGKESALNTLSIGKKYKTQINIIGGSVLSKDGTNMSSQIVISGRNADYKSVLSGSSSGLVELTENISYVQLFLPVGATFDNLQLYCGLYENIIPSKFIVKNDIDVLVSLPSLSRVDNINPIRYQGNKSTIKEYPTILKAKQVLEIPGTYFNAIQGGCTDGTYLYCGVVNNSNDEGNTTVHKIDIRNWKIVKTVTEYSLGHCNSMTYCDYDGYIHCIGLESYNNYKVVHRITTDLEYVDSYTIDLSPYYSESTGIGAIDYNPNTEQFIFLIRGNKKGYAFYSKNKTFIKIVWTEKLNGTYAGVSTDNNFIYQSVWVGGDTNTVGIFDYEGNTLVNINITDMIGEIEETFIYKDKMISVVNHGYTNHLVYEISLDDFISV